jgi:membrane protein YdbS with pleckstrin-like domain
LEPTALGPVHHLLDRCGDSGDLQPAQVEMVNAGTFTRPIVAAAGATKDTVVATPGWLANAMDPKVDSEIMVEIGERKVLEIRKHWVASSRSILKLAFATTIWILQLAWSPETWYGWVGWFALFSWVVFLSVRAVWRITEHYRDRFVITNQRIVRIDGVIGSDSAMIPLGKVTDITVKQSWLGKILNYGHMIFESAGQVQGLDEIRNVEAPHKKKRVLLIAMRGDNPAAMVLNPAENNPNDDGT